MPEGGTIHDSKTHGGSTGKIVDSKPKPSSRIQLLKTYKISQALSRIDRCKSCSQPDAATLVWARQKNNAVKANETEHQEINQLSMTKEKGPPFLLLLAKTNKLLWVSCSPCEPPFVYKSCKTLGKEMQSSLRLIFPDSNSQIANRKY